VSYSIPQGMVRGASLELMDHTFDGIEDSQTGDLRGGLGQLVDGKYGWDNFKATSPGGQIKGTSAVNTGSYLEYLQPLIFGSN